MMTMMDGGTCGWAMMAGMGFISILLITMLVLGIAALAKYLFKRS